MQCDSWCSTVLEEDKFPSNTTRAGHRWRTEHWGDGFNCPDFFFFLIHQQSLFIWHSYLTVELSIYKGCCKYHIWKYQYYNNKLRIQFNISGFALSPQIPLYQHHVFFVVFVYSSHLISAALDATVCILLAFSLWLQQEPFILSFRSFPSSQNYLGSAQRGIQCSQGCNTVHLHLSILTSLSDG